MNWNCRICNVEFVRDEVCVTCGAEKLYDATVKNLQEDLEHYKEEAHYANGVADLAMRQRDEAEAKVDALKDVMIPFAAICLNCKDECVQNHIMSRCDYRRVKQALDKNNVW